MTTSFAVRPLAGEGEREWCARVMAASEPWITLGRTYEAALRIVGDPSREVWVAHDGDGPAGFVILNLGGPFVGYVQTICIAPDRRGQGLGSRLLAFAEERIFRVSPNVFLCVSSFNADARRLYERSGYRLVGALDDYLVGGHAELLYRKTRGPWNDFTPAPDPSGPGA